MVVIYLVVLVQIVYLMIYGRGGCLLFICVCCFYWVILFFMEVVMFLLFCFCFVCLLCICLVIVCLVIVCLLVLFGLVVVEVVVDVFIKDLDIVVVMVLGSQQWIKDVLVSISVIGCEDIECQLVLDLVVLFSCVLGVIGGFSVVGEQFKIKLCGMLFNYMLVLVDGKCMGSLVLIYYCFDFGCQDLNWIFLDQIECIEVVCGLMLLLYGFDVMGGVINIIIWCIGDEWNGSVIYSYICLVDGKCGDIQQIGVIFFGLLGECFGLCIGVNSMCCDLDCFNGGVYGNVYVGEKDCNVDVLLQWKLSDVQELLLEVGYGVQQVFIDVLLEKQDEGVWGVSEFKCSLLVFNYDGRWCFGNLKISVYWIEYKNDIGVVGCFEVIDMIIEGSLIMLFIFGVEYQFVVGG